MDINYYSQIFKTLSHPIRLKIAMGLFKKEECNVMIMAEKLQISQPVISQHLAIMKKGNIVDFKREGNRICYFLKDETIKNIIKNIKD